MEYTPSNATVFNRKRSSPLSVITPVPDNNVANPMPKGMPTRLNTLQAGEDEMTIASTGQKPMASNLPDIGNNSARRRLPPIANSTTDEYAPPSGRRVREPEKRMPMQAQSLSKPPLYMKPNETVRDRKDPFGAFGVAPMPSGMPAAQTQNNFSKFMDTMNSQSSLPSQPEFQVKKTRYTQREKKDEFEGFQ